MILTHLQNAIFSYLIEVGAFFAMIWEVICIACFRPPSWKLIRDQLYEIGVLSLPVVAITGFCTGTVLAAQSFFQLSDKGLAGATGIMVAKSMIVELGPVLTAFMVTGRVGAAMCAELGTMRVTEQIDALCSMAVDPLQHLVVPRFIAGCFMLPLLTVFSAAMGIGGGFILSVYLYGMQPQSFIDPLPVHLCNFDFISGFVKAFFFGFVIVSISCYRGTKTKGGAQGVGRATTQSVVICYSTILIGNFFVTIGLNNFYWYVQNLIKTWFS
ncbi:MAG: putative transporter permease protein [Chlamydiales bacterium]|jgi:phospholipid/cholesterol/gamma-HCH transport system permease protein|nr:putative transporter permease protein [Chlamydiales bacterium]